MDMYDDAEWEIISIPPPLSELDADDLGLLHRHWMWANQQRERSYELLGQQAEPVDPHMYLAERTGGSMLAWYALLWSVIEALRDDRGIELRDSLASAVEVIADLLRRCRNAVLHVPCSGDYFDQRIINLIAYPDSVRLIRTVHSSLGRLLLEEMRRRQA